MPVDVKICGIKTADMAHVAAKFGARWLGFVFYGPSPRNLTLAAARSLGPLLPEGPERVGVFVSPSYRDIAAATEALDLDTVQVHGALESAFVDRLKNQLGLKVVKAIGVSEPADIEAARADIGLYDAILFDAKPPKVDGALPGGNAVSFPWDILRGQDLPFPWFLAGGLTADNVAEAVAASGAKAVDVSSGVESVPGEKSAEKIEAFLRAAKTIR